MIRHKRISEKLAQKKIDKENKLLESAYNLFLEKGVDKTSVDEIVKKAGVAKGTFYIYFRDKEEIVEKLILIKSAEVTKLALEETLKNRYSSFIDGMLFFIDYIIEYLNKHKYIFNLINKNLSWGFYKKVLSEGEQFESIRKTKDLFMKNMQNTKFTNDELEKIIFMIFELIGTMSYNSIIKGEPDNIKVVKPVLLKMIRKIFE
ncbi:TetR/AcrR family transcriptional regulator [Caldicellulosiruptoraceae bacterium PP1]